MNRLVWLLCLSILFFASFTQAKPLTREQVPEPLKPWISWVVQDNPELACPFLYNSYEQKRCSWPTQLSLDLTSSKGVFSISWKVYKESWVSLPGDSKHWPLNVTVNGKPALVMNKNGIPSIKLAADLDHQATYHIKGEFLWDVIPDNLMIPDDTGLINLTIKGLAIPAPTIKDGQLWLKESDSGQSKPENIQNNLEIQAFRKIIDEVPLQVLTRLELDVSGEQREVKLAYPLLNGFIPLQLQSPLPARLEPDGQLVVQVRPGRWQIEILARISKNPDMIPYPKESKDWPESEIWVFESRPELRVVEIEQLNTIDASQTNLPEDWKNLPAYKINQGQVMGFKVIRRGDPEPEPNQLSLTRRLWLDFDGKGYTVNDAINGKMTSGWRLNTLPDTQLGKVTLDGNNQLITQQAGTEKQGVEVRKGMIMLNADSRIKGDIDTISAVGWEQTFHNVSAELNLPPGWRLLAASGVDNVPDSWISRWTLLDLFLVLITALATGRIWNHYWGALALVTLVIIWHEPGAPHYTWLNILAATALLGVLPQGRFYKLTRWYLNVCWLALVVITVPFMVSQVRMGIYPQLENPWQDIHVTSRAESPMPAPATMPMEAMDAAQQQLGELAKRARSKNEYERAMPEQKASGAYYGSSATNFERIDPKAKVQTGPGLPQWQWNKVYLSWNGSVDPGQQLGLWYLSPGMTMLLNFLRVALVAILALLMFGVAEKFRPDFIRKLGMGNKATPLLIWFILLPLLSIPSPNIQAAEFPSETLLNELKNRLQEVEMPDCLPVCAQIQQMNMVITDKIIEITLQIDAQESVTLPLPSEYNQWFPNQVLDNGEPAQAVYRNNNTLWINLKKGEHKVILKGLTPLLSKFTLPLPLKPNRITVEKSGWEVVGVHENGWSDDQLQFSRIQQTRQDKTKPVLEPGVLPPFVRVERLLSVGLDWRVITRIIRISPADSAVVLTVPLLPGESVTSPGVRVKDNAVEVNMAAQQTVMQWDSTLEKTDKIELIAPQTDQWIEVWQVDVSPIWHIDPSGIAMIHLNSEGQWLPEWHPWPGEKITLQITRPKAVEGQTLTIDSSSLGIKPGQRTQDAELKLSLRSSQGSQHTLTLPENAVLQSVAIDGQTQPIRQQGRKLTLPVNPGKQEVLISWQETKAIATAVTTPLLDLGQDSVNTNLSISLGQDRWVLFVMGPRMGPAVLFWGVLIVIFILSLALGKIRLTPLKNWHWFLLLVGLSQIPMASAGIVIAWLMLLGWRANQTVTGWRYFNALQIIIGGLTVLAVGVLFAAVAQGLLNSPDMQITGNQSSAFFLNWYQDRSLSTLPTATVISVPLIVYRLLMLAWALWLAVSLLNWLKWGWGCFSSNGLWNKATVKEKEIVVETDKGTL
ncbi:MAG: hypothetical protein LUQ52_02115 [Methylococcaceae bacterium]|nr:hypothetical protein [Methylococcaceae bacterium]